MVKIKQKSNQFKENCLFSDLAQVNYATERDDINTSIGSGTSTMDSHNGTNVYDEPESIMVQNTPKEITKRPDELENDEFEKYLRIS